MGLRTANDTACTQIPCCGQGRLPHRLVQRQFQNSFRFRRIWRTGNVVERSLVQRIQIGVPFNPSREHDNRHRSRDFDYGMYLTIRKNVARKDKAKALSRHQGSSVFHTRAAHGLETSLLDSSNHPFTAGRMITDDQDGVRFKSINLAVAKRFEEHIERHGLAFHNGVVLRSDFFRNGLFIPGSQTSVMGKWSRLVKPGGLASKPDSAKQRDIPTGMVSKFVGVHVVGIHARHRVVLPHRLNHARRPGKAVEGLEALLYKTRSHLSGYSAFLGSMAVATWRFASSLE
jgi:hypothetical protein